MAVDVRRAGPDDWPSARVVRLAALADAPAAFGSTHGREVRFEEAEWRNRIANSAWFLAWLDGDPVGLVVGIADEAAPAERHVVSMWVRTDVRGTDASTALVCAVREWARTQGARAASPCGWLTETTGPAGSTKASASGPRVSDNRSRAIRRSARRSYGSSCDDLAPARSVQRRLNTAGALVIRPSSA